MKILDLDMDYFMEEIVHTSDSVVERLSEEDYSGCVWTETRVRSFLENNLGLTKEKRKKGRIVVGHNESLHFWKELIDSGELTIPYEVVHIDSHADLGLGYESIDYIMKVLLSYPVDKRPIYNKYVDFKGTIREESIGDYLLFAIAYRWISKLTYCANPNGDKNDYLWVTLKNFQEHYIWDQPVENIIQLLFNRNTDLPKFKDSIEIKEKFIKKSQKEPEIPLLIIPTTEDVKYYGDFDFVVLAQSPNYTPKSADFIINVFKEYIVEY